MATVSSFPSKAMVLLNVPEVTGLETTFVYNMFAPNERVSETGGTVPVADYGLLQVKKGKHGKFGYEPPGLSDPVDPANLMKELNHVQPRYIEIKFKPILQDTLYAGGSSYIQGAMESGLAHPSHGGTYTNDDVASLYSSEVGKILKAGASIKDNLDYLQNELDVATKGSSAVLFHDAMIQTRLAKLTQFSLGLRDPELAATGSAAEQAKALNNLTDSSVVGNVLFDNVYDPRDKGVGFVDTQTGRIKDISKNYGVAQRRFYGQINDRFLGPIFQASAANPFSPFSSGISQKSLSAQDTTTTAQSIENPAVMSSAEYSTNIIPWEIIYVESASSLGDASNYMEVIGYIIKKEEIHPDGTRSSRDPIILEQSRIGTVIDKEVKYGAVYSYTVQTVMLVGNQAADVENEKFAIIKSMVVSRPCTPSAIVCQEFSPPLSPSDFNVIWDYYNHKLVLMWGLPVVRTRDVKRFQVFRRKTVHEPFELLQEYDFDDSEVLTPRRETPDSQLVMQVNNPEATFVDEEFRKDSKYIYAVCCVDAHDLTSNYSQQFVVSFDTYKNTLVKRLLSPSGAPKAYPNFYLLSGVETGIGNTELTVDSMKDSHHRQMKVYFDPEYLEVTNKEGDKIKVLATNQNDAVYKLQVINIDRQKSQVLDIRINDLRTTGQSEQSNLGFFG